MFVLLPKCLLFSKQCFRNIVEKIKICMYVSYMSIYYIEYSYKTVQDGYSLQTVIVAQWAEI